MLGGRRRRAGRRATGPHRPRGHRPGGGGSSGHEHRELHGRPAPAASGVLSRPWNRPVLASGPGCTPGAIDPAVTQADIAATICHTGYTETVRPPESVTEAEKRASLHAYGDRRPLHYYEYDHLVPLELGGARNDVRNLWPEPGTSPNPKDELEYRLGTRVCDGEMKLAAAQLAIAHNWVAAYHRYVGG